MSIHLSWYNSEKTILVWKFEGEWNWVEYHAAINRAVMMLRKVHHTVDSIMDLRDNRGLPSDAIIHGKRWFIVAPDNFGVTVVTGANRLIQGIATTLASVYKQLNNKILVASTFDQAVELILERQRERAAKIPLR